MCTILPLIADEYQEGKINLTFLSLPSIQQIKMIKIDECQPHTILNCRSNPFVKYESDKETSTKREEEGFYE